MKKREKTLSKLAEGKINLHKAYYALYPKERKERARRVKIKMREEGRGFLNFLLRLVFLLPYRLRFALWMARRLDKKDEETQLIINDFAELLANIKVTFSYALIDDIEVELRT